LIQSFKLFGEDADHKVTPLVFKVQAKYRLSAGSLSLNPCLNDKRSFFITEIGQKGGSKAGIAESQKIQET